MVSIKISLLGRQIPLRVQPSEVERVREIALYVDDLMVELRDQISNQPDATILSLGALRLAEDLFKERTSSRERINELEALLKHRESTLQPPNVRQQGADGHQEADGRQEAASRQELTAHQGAVSQLGAALLGSDRMKSQDVHHNATAQSSSNNSFQNPGYNLPHNSSNTPAQAHSSEIKRDPQTDIPTPELGASEESDQEAILRQINRKLERFLDELGE